MQRQEIEQRASSSGLSKASIRGRTGLVEGDHDACDIGGYFKAGLPALQGDDHPLVVLELHTAYAPRESRARADDTVGAGEIAELVDVVGTAETIGRAS